MPVHRTVLNQSYPCGHLGFGYKGHSKSLATNLVGILGPGLVEQLFEADLSLMQLNAVPHPDLDDLFEVLIENNDERERFHLLRTGCLPYPAVYAGEGG